MNRILPAIVVVAYNRPDSLKRLLESIALGIYPADEITLVISIDGGGDDGVLKIAQKFNWKYGLKEIIAHEYNLGLRKHIIKSGDLTQKYGAIIMLEEDCYVSPNYFKYATDSLNYYDNDLNIAGISLYSYSFNENALMPFYPMKDGNDVYFMQIPSSWGQAWSDKQWLEFKKFYENNKSISSNDKLPENVRAWPETSWKKYFYKYLVTNNLFIVYPQVSLSSNCGDVGQHYNDVTSIWRVSLDYRTGKYDYIDFNASQNKYDAYFEILPSSIGLPPNVLIDLYGTKQYEIFEEDLVYSNRKCKNAIRTFDNSLIPNFLNIKYNLVGTSFNLGRRIDFLQLTSQEREKMFRNTNEFIFDSGVQKGIDIGYEKGKTFIKKSIPYKLGSKILRPLKFFLGKK